LSELVEADQLVVLDAVAAVVALAFEYLRHRVVFGQQVVPVADLRTDRLDLAVKQQGEVVLARRGLQTAEERLGGLALDEVGGRHVDDRAEHVGPAVDEAVSHDLPDLRDGALVHLVELAGRLVLNERLDDLAGRLAVEDDDRVAFEAGAEFDADADLLAAVVDLGADLGAAHEVELRHAHARLDAGHAREPTGGEACTLAGHPVERAECVDVEFHDGPASMLLTISTNSSRSGKA